MVDSLLELVVLFSKYIPFIATMNILKLTLGDLAMATVPKSEGVCSLLVIVVLLLVYAFYTKNNSCFGDGKILFVI